MKKSSEKQNDFFDFAQKILKEPPVVIWGSGATIPYGMPSMFDLNQKIGEKVKDFNPSSGNLEEELGKEQYSKILPGIRKIIWEEIYTADMNAAHKLVDEPSQFEGIKQMFEKFVEPEPKLVNIITTNYDRVLENVMSYNDIAFSDGFTGRIFSSYNEKNFKSMNSVNLIKVHGSLNWTLIHDDIHYWPDIEKYDPVIIPPGKNKYREAFKSPYRELIQKSDSVIEAAKSFLIVGFGFNDEHLTPKIIKKIKAGTPLTIITKKITDTTEEVIKKAQYYLLLNEESTGKSRVRIKEKRRDEIKKVINSEYWKLQKFMEIFL
jgi:hypothetical protein